MLSCYPLAEGEILNEEHSQWPLFEVQIYGSKNERIKLSKRMVCALKHLPLRLKISYIGDPQRSIEAGVAKDPSVVMDGEVILEGLVSAEEITEFFKKLLKEKDESFGALYGK